jgi:predicted transcriptional regulator of viral defense system
MDFESLLELVGDEPVFESSLLLAGDVKPEIIRLQLARWTKAGKIYQLRRGLYAPAPPYQKVKPHPFLIANCMQRASYVSCQSALAFYGMIPDVTPLTVSVTAGRPARWETALGGFDFRHVKPDLLIGYRMIELANRQQALVARPEKALLDLVYLQPGGGESDYLRELRLQNLENLDLVELFRQAEHFNTPKLRRAVYRISELAQIEDQEYEEL